MAATAAEQPPGGRVARRLEPLRRLFGPQMSSGARERRDVVVLLLAVTFVVVPHFEHLPWWATALLLLMLFWRGFLTVAQQPLPGRLLMLPLLLGAAFGVYLQHGTVVGQQAGVTFLLLLMALKLLEMRARRDIWSFRPERLARAEDELTRALSAAGDHVLLYDGLATLHWQYINETFRNSPVSDQVGWYVIRVADPSTADQLAQRIDALFANSPNETKTSTEKAWSSDFAGQIGDT